MAAEAEAEAEAEGETSEPEGGERETEESMDDRGEVREPKEWEMVAELLQLEFWEGVLAEEAAWHAVVLIPKGGGDYRSIGLVEVIWKKVVVILNRRFTASITYYDSLHRFRAGRGTGTPQGQADPEDSGLEEGSTPCDLTIPVQGIQ